MNEPTNFESLICKTVDSIYYENMRKYAENKNSDYLHTGWDNLNGLFHLLINYKSENKECEAIIKLVKCYQDRFLDHIKNHNDFKVK